MLGGALSVAVLALLRILGRLPPIQGPSWIAHPLAMHVGFAALTVLTTTAIAAWFVRRAAFWGFWFGASMLAALLSLAIALIIPAAGYVVLLAALAAVLGFVPSAWALIKGRRPSQGAADFAVLFPGLIALALLLPLLLLLVPCARRARVALRHRHVVHHGRIFVAAAGQRDAAGPPTSGRDCCRHNFRRDLHHGVAADLLGELAAARKH